MIVFCSSQTEIEMYYLEFRYPSRSLFLQCRYLKMRIFSPQITTTTIPATVTTTSVKEHFSPIENYLFAVLHVMPIGIDFVKDEL